MSTFNKKNITTTSARGNGRRKKQPEAFVPVPTISRRVIGQIIRALQGVRSATGASYIRFQESQGDDPTIQVNSPTASGRVKIASREKEDVDAAKIAVEKLIARFKAPQANKPDKANSRPNKTQQVTQPRVTPKMAQNPLEAALEAALARGPVARSGRTSPTQTLSTPIKEEGEWTMVGKAVPPASKKQRNKKTPTSNVGGGQKLLPPKEQRKTPTSNVGGGQKLLPPKEQRKTPTSNVGGGQKLLPKNPTGCWGGSLDTIRSPSSKVELRCEPVVVTGAERVVMSGRRSAKRASERRAERAAERAAELGAQRDIASIKACNADAAWEEGDLDTFYSSDCHHSTSAWDDED